MVKATGKKGVPQGGVISPLLSNLYLNEVDRMLEKAIATTRRGKYTHVQYARFADDLVILLDSHPRHGLARESGRKTIARGASQTQRDDQRREESDGEFIEGREASVSWASNIVVILSRNQMWRPQYTPKLKKRKALFVKLREIFRRFISQPVERVIELINPILRGWVNYFAVGHSSRCFAFVKDWVEKKIRRHLMRCPETSRVRLEKVE